MTCHPRCIVFLLVIIATLSSCASMYANQANVAEQIDTWLENNEYERALDTIAAMSPDHKDYNRLSNDISSIEKLRQSYVFSVLTKAAMYEPTQDWRNAEDAISDGLQKLPNSPELKAQLGYYRHKRHHRISLDEAAITVAKAYYLISVRPYHESKLYNADNRFFAQQQYNQFSDQARQVSRELYALGHQYWLDGKLVQARETLTLAVKTAENGLSTDLLAVINDDAQDNRSAERAEQQKQISEQQPELEENFYARMDTGDFVGAQKVLNEMKAINIDSVVAMQAELTIRKNERVNQFINSGNTLYNSGFLTEAILRWQQALALDPQNTVAQQKLERANTFVNNLERWKAEP